MLLRQQGDLPGQLGRILLKLRPHALQALEDVRKGRDLRIILGHVSLRD